MKTLVLTNAKLMHYERSNNSLLSCPSYSLWFTNGTETIGGKTANNTMCGYNSMNFRDGRACNVTYHITRAGNVIINKIEEV